MPSKTIWMNPPLEKLNASLNDASSPSDRRKGQFSQRLGDIVERYDAILKNTAAPELTADEKMIIGVVFGSGNVSPLAIRHMGDSIIDTGAAPIDQLKELAAKANDWTAAEKVALIEALGL